MPANASAVTVDVWYARTLDAASDYALQQFGGMLNAAEREQEMKFRLPELRAQYRLTRILTRTVLGRLACCNARDLAFEVGPYGKPYLREPSEWACGFNISHTRGAVLLAVAETGHVGADIEPVNRSINLDLADRYFAPLEIAQLKALDTASGERTFMEFWTLKEAFIKALGTGLSTPLHNFAFDLSTSPTPTVATYEPSIGPPSRWTFRQFVIEDEFLCAVAALDSGAEHIDLRIHRWPEAT